MTNATVPATSSAELVDLGSTMLTEPVQLLAHVPEVLTEVGA